MTNISELKNSANVEHIADTLFGFIQDRSNHSSLVKELVDFDDNIIQKNMNLLQDLVSLKTFEGQEYLDKKEKLNICHTELIKFKNVFKLLDEKVDNEIKNNTNLSQDDKEELLQEFLYTIRQKHLDLSMNETQYSNISKLLKDKEVVQPETSVEKKSFSDRIKFLRNFGNNSSENKNKLK